MIYKFMTAAVRVCENVRQNCRYAILKNNLRRTENDSQPIGKSIADE